MNTKTRVAGYAARIAKLYPKFLILSAEQKELNDRTEVLDNTIRDYVRELRKIEKQSRPEWFELAVALDNEIIDLYDEMSTIQERLDDLDGELDYVETAMETIHYTLADAGV